jgi:prepilin-type N-terminal cleavage/methylation domain-containing protein
MMFHIIKLFHKNRVGFTLIEMLAAIAITGVIALGASISIAQVLNQTTRDNDFTTASHNAMNALHWMSRDALMAQTVTGTEGFPLTQDLSMKWTGWDNSIYTANYTLTDGELRRIYSNGTEVSSTVIAENINPASGKTSCVSENGTITITITSSVGAGDKIIDVTRVREISSRPNL